MLIHGWPLHAATYRHIVEHLKQHFTCHLFDLPGAGHTKTSPQTSFNFHATAHALIAARKMLGISAYSLIAHDSGGTVARVMADSDAGAVESLILADTEIPHYHSPLIRLLINTGKRPKRFELFVHLLKYKLIRHSQLGFGGCFHDKQKIDEEFLDLFAKPMLENSNALNGQRQVVAAMSLRDINALQTIQLRIQQPVLLLWGEKDPFFPIEKAKTMLTDFNNATLEVIKNGKLFIHEEYPQPFADHAQRFLQGTQQTPFP